MNTKVLLSGLIGFFIGGLLVSAVATATKTEPVASNQTMSATEMIKNNKGGDFDKAYIEHMIGHHQDAVNMSVLAEENAEHQEIKDLAKDIISSQSSEITKMNQWMVDWGYTPSKSTMMHSSH